MRCSGAWFGAQQTLRCGVGDIVSMESPDTLLGFETTSPCPCGLGVAPPSACGVGVLLPCFGGGVWCLICG